MADQFLGLRIQCTTEGVTLSQGEYIQRVLTRFGMDQACPKFTPMSPGIKLTTEEKIQGMALEEANNQHEYRALVGAVIHLASWTRPDIGFVVSLLGRYSSNPGAQHWKIAKCLLQYLKATKDIALTYGINTKDCVLTAYCDSDFAMDPSAKSVTGFVVMLNGATIASKSRRQRLTALSSTEAESIALSECARVVVSMRARLKALGYPQEETIIHVDNAAVIHLVHRPDNGSRSKHFATKIAYVRDYVDRKALRIVFTPTENNVADLLTKPLARYRTRYLRNQILGIDPLDYKDDTN